MLSQINPNWHELWKQETCQINPIDVNFHLQKSFEIFDKNSATKSLVQKGQEVESVLPHAN